VPLSYGLLLRLQGSVVGLLVFGWGDVAQGAVQAAVVVSVDPACGGVLDVGEGLVGAVVEDAGADAFGLVQPDDGLHEGVVQRRQLLPFSSVIEGPFV
jgi:hypothetical protein